MQEGKNKQSYYTRSKLIIFNTLPEIFIVDKNKIISRRIQTLNIDTNIIIIKDPNVSINLSNIFIKDINTNHDCRAINKPLQMN